MDLITAARATQGKTVTNEMVTVLKTFHDEMAMYHLRQTYRLHNIWEHQQATNAHRAAKSTWRRVRILDTKHTKIAELTTEKAIVLSEELVKDQP